MNQRGASDGGHSALVPSFKGFDASGAVANVNVFAPDGLVARKEGSTWNQFVFDLQGNTVQKLTTSQAVSATRLTDAWGEGVETTTPKQIDPFLFNGKWGYYYDRETALYLCQHRMYDASAGRWINRDPIGYAGGMNLYGYCGGGPVGSADPRGYQGGSVGGPMLLPQDLAEGFIQGMPDGVEGVGAGLLTSAIAFGHGALAGADAGVNSTVLFGVGMMGGPQSNMASILDPYMNRPGAQVSEFFWGIAGAARGLIGMCELAPVASGPRYFSHVAGEARSTYRSRHWKARAKEAGAVDEFGAGNVERMRRGRAPQRYNGDKGGMESMELAHDPDPWGLGGTRYRELWPQEHARIDPWRRPGY